jgi:hypothetical protein
MRSVRLIKSRRIRWGIMWHARDILKSHKSYLHPGGLAALNVLCVMSVFRCLLQHNRSKVRNMNRCSAEFDQQLNRLYMFCLCSNAVSNLDCTAASDLWIMYLKGRGKSGRRCLF